MKTENILTFLRTLFAETGNQHIKRAYEGVYNDYVRELIATLPAPSEELLNNGALSKVDIISTYRKDLIARGVDCTLTQAKVVVSAYLADRDKELEANAF